MGNAEKYRANALKCMARAKRADSRETRIMWLEMAQRWFGMMPAAQRVQMVHVEAAARRQETGQERFLSKVSLF